MLCRERLMNSLMFKPVDRIPLVEWPIRKATMDVWVAQGYPEGLDPQVFFGLDTFHINVPIVTYMHPKFETKILEETDDYKIWQDDLGAIRKDFSRDKTPGFVTRTWLDFPVSSKDDFLKMKSRYNSADPDRYPQNWSQRARIINKSIVANHLSIPFLFWTARDWMGFENLCLAFYDDPLLIEEMFSFITDMIIETLDRGIDQVDLDIVELKEDMAYKGAPMISPDLFKRFMQPHYRRLVDYLRGKGAKIIYVDCDGYPGKLLPLWMETGVNGISPCEIAAGNDLVGLRQAYSDLVLFGGIDKRELTKGRTEIRNEVMRQVPHLIERGGYVPHVDHAIPPDIPLENYLYYREFLTSVIHTV